jgi:hypothetical protein
LVTRLYAEELLLRGPFATSTALIVVVYFSTNSRKDYSDEKPPKDMEGVDNHRMLAQKFLLVLEHYSLVCKNPSDQGSALL